ncbi:protein FAM204A isoform X2 [Lingula anatina]|uniref:Protein FAM204A isoform X2 n=1 Tax=Lingula anatina TaxID=7574 RepID=A0A1S3HHK5_LINAN|nr:protein FAM204A isoform X2 [Lingula anatina]|eukprot:XP_013385507.1 protein FAM204A isoform X2 [Lingula anatina]
MYSRVPPPTKDDLRCDVFNNASEDNGPKANNGDDKVSAPEVNKKNHDTSDSTERPKNISQQAWEKFQALRKRREDMSRKSTEKRIRDLQKNVLQKVSAEIQHPEDINIMRKHNVRIPGRPNQETGNTEKKKRKHSSTEEYQILGRTASCSEQEEWQNIKQYLGASDHLKGTDLGKHAPKTKLEDIDLCVKQGDFETAEKLSDKLANREFANVCE